METTLKTKTVKELREQITVLHNERIAPNVPKDRILKINVEISECYTQLKELTRLITESKRKRVTFLGFFKNIFTKKWQ